MTDGGARSDVLEVIDLGRMRYAEAFDVQRGVHAEVLSWREEEGEEGWCTGGRPVGKLLLVEHDPPVITVSNRPTALEHLVAGDARLAELGVEVEQTDRGGDITYHGPGQLVAYPIVDLNRLKLRLHAYMRGLEETVIRACARLEVPAMRDADATGVWTVGPGGKPEAKVCAIGIRVRRWVTTHGLALNVRTDLSHFDLIVPCGLAGRAVTSVAREAGEGPTVGEAGRIIAQEFEAWMLELLDAPDH